MNPDQSHTISQVGDNTAPEPVSKKTEAVNFNSNSYNMRCPAVKRLMREAAELMNPEYEYTAHPTDANLFEWHFTIRGPEGCEFENGLYHGRIILPSEYPMKPPTFIFLTPNGRFQTEEKICLSISNYHPETWLPSWSIRTALVALCSFMTTPGNEGAIGSLNFSPEERKKLANKSRSWECRECGPIIKLLPAHRDAKGDGDSPDSCLPAAATASTNSETSSDANQQQGVAEGTTKAKPETVTTTNATPSTSTNADNRLGEATSATSNARASASTTQLLQQQQEPIKNIIYDLGIGCFVVLILALCLRRLLTIFLRQ